MTPERASFIWQTYRVTANIAPSVLRWDAQDYRDAAALHFATDPEAVELLTGCAESMVAAAMVIEADELVPA